MPEFVENKDLMRLRSIFTLTTVGLAVIFAIFAAVSALTLTSLQEKADQSAQSTTEIEIHLEEVVNSHQQGVNNAREMAISILEEEIVMARYLNEDNQSNLSLIEAEHDLASLESLGNHQGLNAFLNQEELNLSMEDVLFSHNALIYEFSSLKDLKKNGTALTHEQIVTFGANLAILVTLTIDGGGIDNEVIDLLTRHGNVTFNQFSAAGSPYDGNNVFSTQLLQSRVMAGERVFGLFDIIDMLDARILEATDEAEQLTQDAMSTSQDAQSQASLVRNLVFGFAGIFFVVAIVAGMMLTRTVDRPLRALTSAMEKISLGEFDVDVPDEGPQEAREMRAAFNRMVVSLKLLSK